MGDESANPLRAYFDANSGRLIHKWLHYFDAYHRHLLPFRGKAVTLIEFGVFQGGSLQMWKNYLGPQALIVGVDIKSVCKRFEEPQVLVRVGDQEDRSFLKSLLREFPKPDIVIDDGGHRMSQQIATFEEFFPAMADTGVYIAEDLHTSYWEEFGGGYRRESSFIEYAKRLIDQLNAWHTRSVDEFEVDDFTLQARSMHFYDSMLVIERGPNEMPKAVMTGVPLDS